MTLLKSRIFTEYGKLDSFIRGKCLLIFLFAVIISFILWHFGSRRDQIQSFNINGINNRQSLSPFSRTLAFIRWNSAHNDRIPIIEKYRPFFTNLHYSIPDSTSNLNYTVDGWKSGEFIYKAVGDTMQIILQNYSNIEGVLYFHFDVSIFKRKSKYVLQ